MICGKELKVLTRHIMLEHGVSKRKYHAKFPGADIVEPEFAERARRNRENHPEVVELLTELGKVRNKKDTTEITKIERGYHGD